MLARLWLVSLLSPRRTEPMMMCLVECAERDAVAPLGQMARTDEECKAWRTAFFGPCAHKSEVVNMVQSLAEQGLRARGFWGGETAAKWPMIIEH
jgi:hypothetical protein